MSSTMLETQTCPALHLSSQDHIHFLPNTGSHDWPAEAKLVEVTHGQLVRLASQHHASEYSRLKFGPKGCPVAYVPLSLQMPERVRQLQAHQARYATTQAWWLCERKAPQLSSMVAVDVAAEAQEQPRLSCPPSVSDIQQELHAAISSPLVPSEHCLPATSHNQLSIKTSSSHPINISPVIPLELMRLISAHLTPENGDHSPIMFHLPPLYFLDHIIVQSPGVPPGMVTSPSHICPYPRPSITTEQPMNVCSPLHSLSSPGRLSHLFWNHPTLRRALHMTLNSHGHGKHLRPTPKSVQPLSAKASETAAAHRAYSSDDISSSKESLRRSHSTSSVLTRLTSDMPAGATRSETCEVLGTFPQPRRSISHSHLQVKLGTASAPVSSNGHPPVPPKVPEQFSLGNMYLSSCPGKKVRLSGPVKGKCGVCRDLRSDLQRIRSLGVTCIVCCLDDDELELLGVPWSQYSCAAEKSGLDVLRIPTPEGLTPASIPDFDNQLTKLIKSYTLNGKPVLVHCRGGVGRAGLVACCWILKLGLCGWIESSPELAFTAPEDLPDLDYGIVASKLPVRSDVMQLVERVITVIRRRRSPKAVETYEQVRFLVDFVEYQRRIVQAGRAQVEQQDLAV